MKLVIDKKDSELEFSEVCKITFIQTNQQPSKILGCIDFEELKTQNLNELEIHKRISTALQNVVSLPKVIMIIVTIMGIDVVTITHEDSIHFSMFYK